MKLKDRMAAIETTVKVDGDEVLKDPITGQGLTYDGLLNLTKEALATYIVILTDDQLKSCMSKLGNVLSKLLFRAALFHSSTAPNFLHESGTIMLLKLIDDGQCTCSLIPKLRGLLLDLTVETLRRAGEPVSPTLFS